VCIEPLSPAETNFINTAAEGMRMVREINHPNFKIHLDVKAMSSEPTPVPDIICSVRAEDIGHFHVNDPNLYGPGMGDVDYGPIAKAIKNIGYDKWLSVEVFKYDPDPQTIAQKSIEYLRSFWPR
jgi:sugar phosphate isomerase/epimerase